jgi:type IV secretion system protein VirB9
MKWAVLLLLFAPCTAGAQAPDDPRIQSIDYVPGQVTRIEATPGYMVTIALAPDEHVETVAVGDGGAWQVNSNRRGDRLFVKPVAAGVTTNMVVVTDTRTYAFELTPGSGANMVWQLSFHYPSAGAQNLAPAGDGKIAARYSVRGDKNLRPANIYDDGVHTYIEWPADQDLPAVYALNSQGQETLANGMMRDGRMVIDSVQNMLVFRIDNRKAQAVRVFGQP